MIVYTCQRIPLPKNFLKVEHTYDICTFKYDHGDCRLQKIIVGIIQLLFVAIFDKLVAVVRGSTRWIFLKNQFLYTDVYCDAIQYEGLVFASTTHGTIFAWDPRSFGTFVFHRNYNCFIHMHAGYQVSLY